MMVGAIVVLFVFVAALGELHRRSRVQIARLERTRTLDPATLLGTPFALERELGHAIGLPQPLSQAEIQIGELSRAREAAMVLRSVCIHGLDQVFCLDLARGSFFLVIYGKLDPAQVADFFLAELGAHRIAAKIGWAYTCSADPAVRKGVRAAAHAAVLRVAGQSGIEVALVEPSQWPADDRSELILGDLRTRREALCLSRKELAPLVGVSELELRNIETGRARLAQVATFILRVVDTIEHSIARVKNLDAIIAAGHLRQKAGGTGPGESSASPFQATDQDPAATPSALEPPASGEEVHTDEQAGAVERIAALQQAILKEIPVARKKSSGVLKALGEEKAHAG